MVICGAPTDPPPIRILSSFPSWATDKAKQTKLAATISVMAQSHFFMLTSWKFKL
jgi:hypothetical protein